MHISCLHILCSLIDKELFHLWYWKRHCYCVSKAMGKERAFNNLCIWSTGLLFGIKAQKSKHSIAMEDFLQRWCGAKEQT